MFKPIHKNPKIKQTSIYLNRWGGGAKIKITNHAKLLRIAFSETGTIHKHISNKLKTCYASIKQLYRFSKVVKGDFLYKVYRTCLEPIIIYESEVL